MVKLSTKANHASFVSTPKRFLQFKVPLYLGCSTNKWHNARIFGVQAIVTTNTSPYKSLDNMHFYSPHETTIAPDNTKPLLAITFFFFFFFSFVATPVHSAAVSLSLSLHFTSLSSPPAVRFAPCRAYVIAGLIRVLGMPER